MFKYLYHGDNIDLITSGLIVTEYLLESEYVMIVQDAYGEVVEIAHTDFKEYE
jgi:hypothetical protein